MKREFSVRFFKESMSSIYTFSLKDAKYVACLAIKFGPYLNCIYNELRKFHITHATYNYLVLFISPQR